MLCSRRSGRWLSALLAAVIAGEVCVPGEVSAQGPRSNSKTASNTKIITWRAAETTQDNCVAILGEIATPGAYCLDARSLSVQSLVRRAGGVTDEASMAIRLIRHDRVNQTLFLSPHADTPLLPGDVLIVESKRALLGTSKVINVSRPTNGARPIAANPSESQGIQIAYLNVLDRPVIVKLRNEEARLDLVVQMLGQPVELAGAVRVVGPERTASAAQLATTSPRLTDGTVLIFPKGAVNRNKLPATLPKPYDSEIATGAFPSLIGGALGQSAELRSVGQLAPLMIAPGREAVPSLAPWNEPAPGFQAQAPGLTAPTFSVDPPSSPFPSPSSRVEAIPSRAETPASRVETPASQTLAPQQTSPQPQPQMPVVLSRPRVATLPFAGSAPLRNSSSRGPIEPESNAPPPEEHALRRSQNGQTIARAESAPSLPAAQGTLETLAGSTEQSRSASTGLATNEGGLALHEPGASPFSAGQMFGILAGVSVLIGAALLARKQFNKQSLEDLSPSTAQGHAHVSQTPIEIALAAAETTVATAAKTESSGTLEPASSLIESPQSASLQPSSSQATNSRSASSLAATLPAGMSDLDQLIKNTLPLREEASAFPSGIILQGRLAPRPIYRVDRAAENAIGSGPHFATRDSSSENRSERFETTEQSEPTAEQLELDTHPPAETRLSGPHFGRRRSGAQTVAVGESARAVMPVAPTTAQSTPLADALRQLQGDRPS